jgi:hypothetical protein
MIGGIPSRGESDTLTVVRYGRFWAVYDNSQRNCDNQPSDSDSQSNEKQEVGQLVCLTVYRKGAREVVRRLEAAAPRAATDDEKGTH